MKKLYWRPQAVSLKALVLVGLFSIAGAIVVENFKSENKQSLFDEKMKASQLALTAMESVRAARVQAGYEIDPEVDPAQSGLIGLPMSSVTSVSGILEAKQTTANPNFAAIVVDLLVRAGVREGDTIAVGCSGSFPALNICVYAALETLRLKPIIVSSASASQWGANMPELLWIDMERILKEEGTFTSCSIAASIGGFEDSGLGLSGEGKTDIARGIERNKLKLLDPKKDFTAKVDERMELYKSEAKGAPIKAYINIGGGAVSNGRTVGKNLFHPGLNKRAPLGAKKVDGLMSRFISDGTPVIHMVKVSELAERYEIALTPRITPPIGDSNVFSKVGYNRWLAAVILVIILTSLFGFIRSDIGFRLFQTSGPKKGGSHPEPMV
ncbi:poly-gamma-glutamate system protein [Akkermansiaceae bacterium]|nr:poly-gamma-glutamate system protein [Akkermansiaceae bacterium]